MRITIVTLLLGDQSGFRRDIFAHMFFALKQIIDKRRDSDMEKHIDVEKIIDGVNRGYVRKVLNVSGYPKH
jgi:hypothetical protein